MRNLALVTALSLAAFVGGTHAQQPAPQVSVGFGSELQSKAQDYGDSALSELREDLQHSVGRAISRSGRAPVRADLVIEDAKPNRPTMAQLSRTPGLSIRSIAIGGARVSGTVTTRDGATVPVRFQWYETDLSNEHAANTWSDAERSFDMLAHELADGRIPGGYRGPGSSGSGHFGFPPQD